MKKRRILSFVVCLLLIFATFADFVHATDKNVDSSVSEKQLCSDEKYENAIDFPCDQAENTERQTQTDINLGFEKSVTRSLSAFETLNVKATSDEIVASIASSPSVVINGTVTKDNKVYGINEYYDFSQYDRYSIASWAFESGLITEDQKIDCYCELILNRNFQNITCLEYIFNEIQEYYFEGNNNSELNQKIANVLSPDIYTDPSDSTRALSSNYTSDNFKVHYDPDHTTQSTAKSVADFYEEIREFFIDLGYRTPILEVGRTRYQIYLKPDPDPTSVDNAGSCVMMGFLRTCSSHIEFYNFSVFGTPQKQTAIHEYFHAIQNAYNSTSGWFKEACADLAVFMKNGKSFYRNSGINDFIASTLPLNDLETKYGAVVFPLTIYHEYGGSSTIKSIYEVYADADLNSTETELQDVITEGLVDTGYTSASFDSAYRKMSAWLCDTEAYYTAYILGILDNRQKATKNVAETNYIHATNASTSFSETITTLYNKHYEIVIPQDFEGALKISISYSQAKGSAQIYRKHSDNSSSIEYPSTSNLKTSYIHEKIDSSVDSLIIVISNTSAVSNLSYTVNLTLIPLEYNMTLTAGTRFMERGAFLSEGEIAEFNVTFSTATRKIIQTFGVKDTVLELYSSDGTLIKSNDDGGYNTNSFICYPIVTPGTEYKIRVRFYNASTKGEFKLAINPAFDGQNSGVRTLSCYEDIYTQSVTNTYTWYSHVEPSLTRVMTITAVSSGSYRFAIESDFDTYIYVFDPRSARLMVNNTDYQDDYEDNYNPALEKELNAGVPYYVIVSAYNPGSITEISHLDLVITRLQ